MIEPVLQSLSLEDTVTIVTGGGSGLGREMALAVARAGGDVVLAGRRPEPIEGVADDVRSIGPRAVAQPTDITDSAQVGRLVETVMREFGHVDVLINNAGMVGGQGASRSGT